MNKINDVIYITHPIYIYFIFLCIIFFCVTPTYRKVHVSSQLDLKGLTESTQKIVTTFLRLAMILRWVWARDKLPSPFYIKIRHRNSLL